MSFWLKTVVGVALIEAALLYLLLFSSNAALAASLDSELEKRATTTLRMLSATVRDDILSEDFATVQSFADEALGIPDVDYVAITDDAGQILGQAGRQRSPDRVDDVYSESIAITVEDDLRATILIELSTANSLMARRELQRKNSLIAASEMLLVALFSLLLGRYLTRELKQLQRATTAIASGELGVTIPVRGSDELAEVAQSFNHMSEELLRSRVQQLASEDRLASILDDLHDGVCLVDSRNHVSYLNPRATSYLGELNPEWRPDQPLTHLGPHSLQDVRTSDRGRALLEIEQDGGQRAFDVHVLDEVGDRRQEGSWILTMRDVTAERVREAHDRRQEQLAVVGQLAAGIAHDNNNILGVIMGVAETNLMAADELPATLRDDFETIHGQAQRSSQLIRQILDFSRGGEAESKDMDVGQALRSIIEILQRTIPGAVTLTCDVEEDGLIAPFNETKFQQVLTNLVLNACAAMPDGGPVHVHARRVDGYGLRPNAPEGRFERWIVVTVEDSGEGIPSKNIQRIYDPFFTTKDVGEGVGLGLAQVYGILRRQGCDIHVDSTVGKGTCFSLFIPPSAPSEAASAPAMNESELVNTSGAGSSILVVDDHEALRKTFRSMLQSIGYEVLSASSGEEGIERFTADREAIAAILTDMVMPGIDGLQMADRLRRLGCDVPIVLVSGYFEREHDDRPLLQSGVDAFLQKPVGLEELARALDRVLTSKGQQGRA